MAQFPQFESNVRFLEYLKRLHDNQDLREALKRRDYSSLITAPGLSEEERNFIKLINWDNFEIFPDEAMEPVLVEAGQVCEAKVGSGYAERRCWKN
jgi:hypothetical protein